MNSSSGERNPVERLAEDFLDRKRRGERPTLQDYLDRHPELAGEIRDLFPALLMMEDLGESAGGTTGSLAAGGVAVAARLERLGGYRILREIGRGGGGGGYEARQGALRRGAGLEGPSARSARGPQAGAAVRARGEGRGAAAPHQYRSGLRRGLPGWTPLLRDAVHRRAGPGRRPGGPAALAAGAVGGRARAALWRRGGGRGAGPDG